MGSKAKVVTITAKALAGVDIEQRHGSSPDTAGIESENAGFLAVAFKCRPMAKDYLEALGLALFIAEPGGVAGWCAADPFFAFEVEFAVSGTKAHTREIVGNYPQAGNASEFVVPLGRFVAVHAIQKRAQQVVVTQRVFDFACALEGLFQAPLRWYSCVHEGYVAFRIVVQQRLSAQP